MRSLLARIFLSFWLMIVITIAAAAALGFFYAERARDAIERFEVSDAMVEASTALRTNGREGLEAWLESLEGVTQSIVYVVDDRGADILDRRLPAPVAIALRRFGDGRRPLPERREPGNLRPARPFTQLVDTDGKVYTIFALPPQSVVGRWLAQRSFATIALLALLASALVSFLLARTISKPVLRLRDTAARIAGGNLDTRVPPDVSRRSDEIGLLGKEFDQMASELQRSLERQTELTANVSHELRSPLARLRIALELARRKAGELSEFDKIDNETERLDALIGQILEFSRLDASSREQKTHLNLVDLVTSIIDDVRFEFGEDVAIEFDEPDAAVDIDVYEGALRSCLSNVLVNAALHGGAGGAIKVSLEREGQDAVIAVEDRGGGVSEEDLGHLFEPFFRASQPDGGSAQGTGLGLAIAARAIGRHGGHIEALNGDGGLRVIMRLPA